MGKICTTYGAIQKRIWSCSGKPEGKQTFREVKNRKIEFKLGVQSQIFSFTQWRLNHQTTETHIPTQKQTSLSFIFQSKTLVNVILYYNSILRATQHKVYVCVCVCVSVCLSVPIPTHCTITHFGFRSGRIDGVECGLFFKSRTTWAGHFTCETSICIVYCRKLRLG